MIRYHGTPFSGGDINHLALQGRHAMVSFAAPYHITTIAEVCQSFCLDNGAYSSWKSGKEYDFDGYRDWADQWSRHPGCDFQIIPDVISGTEQDNDALLSEFPKSAAWVPVWHLHESIDRLVKLGNEYYRVALGSSGQYEIVGDNRWWNRISEAMSAITDDDGFPICKLHGLRMLDPGVFSYVPFSSADSTNVARNIGLDIRWTGTYVPSTARTRALVIMDRIESHACAVKWSGHHWQQQNFDLVG